ncbi:MAG: ABC transporter substrate-binding protein, partial [Pseudomonadota bacterium]
LAIDANVMTEFVMTNGMGAIDAERMETALEQLALTYEFQTEPDASVYFTDAYLPPSDARMLSQ